MPDPVSRPPYVPADTITPERDITHEHFRPGDQVTVVKGAAGGELWGETMTVVTPSWHTATDEDGWRLRNPRGGTRTFITAHPRYMIHTSRLCRDCLSHQRALEDRILPKIPAAGGPVDCGWYTLTELAQLVHTNDTARGGR
ncbi:MULTISPECIES: hypothetical protein [Streptomyces]|uniref:Uncharacterized protein n=1 Tax=Streptomyces tsukubensis (strain DSM 42081 / NBRC 108919 / NRRL 18488 / 9993) TaxID=1114943 RepID=A0A7G3UM25_STRT9|nr:hypothetical protein [Streptomyces tsukubensis]MYS66522.1 hypothetical protein [Streptomyces sp. SID5473]QKM71437.1 hypothetical protein STSU_007195 [Streptomyces tsukubensis NRRL18488]TAI41535.1 hypothetical protein EWI31_27255 [Streptomyces tsukubensis]